MLLQEIYIIVNGDNSPHFVKQLLFKRQQLHHVLAADLHAGMSPLSLCTKSIPTSDVCSTLTPPHNWSISSSQAEQLWIKDWTVPSTFTFIGASMNILAQLSNRTVVCFFFLFRHLSTLNLDACWFPPSVIFAKVALCNSSSGCQTGGHCDSCHTEDVWAFCGETMYVALIA